MLSNLLDIKCEDEKLLKTALTHPSYTKEHELPVLDNYERLEFLGDAVLKLVTSKLLYEKYPDYDEGKLSKIRSILVSDTVLSGMAKDIDLDKRMILGSGEENTGGRTRESNIACTMEAVLAAYFLDGKFNQITEFLHQRLLPMSDEVDEHFEKYNAKAVLQEYTQKETTELPQYKTVNVTGPNHNPTFEIEVSFKGEVIASGCGKSKKEAQQDAAYKACLKLGVIGGEDE
ncbi:MAG: ribonuclease III [Cyanobacteria bacterium RUI128]|nr:ribonuclease III [Cyanobacteria bacterium RUI128]